MKPLLLAYPGNEEISVSIAEQLGAEPAKCSLRKFPDGETYFQLLSSPKARKLVVVCSLDRPDEKILPLLFISETARDLGVRQIGLVAPYLGYMRQDTRFLAGEAVTSLYFSKLISGYFDWLLTVDPHLHRIPELSRIYSIPTQVLHAAPEISRWIRAHVQRPILIGPDEESAQWVERIAKMADAPCLIGEKARLGDRKVEVTIPADRFPRDRIPVLVDDIVSTGRSMIETLKQIRQHTAIPPICIGVHAIFSGNAHQELLEAGAQRVVTCNTIAHSSNAVDLSLSLAREIQRF